MNLSLLLVTYNRRMLLEKALDNIEKYASSLDELIIVDNNSSDTTFNYLKERYPLEVFTSDFSTEVAAVNFYKAKVGDLKIKVLNLDTNTGGSGGFYTGLKFFSEHSKNEWVWGMDDDAFIKAKALETLESTIKRYKDHRAFWSNCNSDNAFTEEVKSVNTWMFVGFCVHRELINKIGLPVSDYFIYHDDTEYSDRILRNGYEILKVKDSIIEHGDFSNRKVWRRKLGFKELTFPEMQDWKLYYYLRNDILKSSYSNDSKIKKLVSLCKVGARIVVIKPSKFNLVVRALYHGVLNKRGIYIRP